MKPRYKRRLFWTFVILAAILVFAIAMIPAFMTLDRLKPSIQTAILNQTGMSVQIDGHVKLSVLGAAKIVIHNVKIYNYDNSSVESVEFSVPFAKIFDLKSASLSNTLVLRGANIYVKNLIPPKIDKKIVLENSSVQFMGKTYSGISGVLQDGLFTGTLRTDQHKYRFETQDNNFHISAPSEDLDIIGKIMSDQDGNMSAAGTLSISSPDINRFFEFDTPRIVGKVSMDMKFEWKGENFRFYGISGTKGNAQFTGEISFNDKSKSIKLKATELDFDLSFLLQHINFIRHSDFDLDLSGKIHFLGRTFDNVQLKSTDTNDFIKIQKLQFISDKTSGNISGKITGDMADLSIDIIEDGNKINCEFSGTPNVWQCKKWGYVSSDISASGTLSMTSDSFEMDFNTDDISALNFNPQKITNFISRDNGSIHVSLADNVTGDIEVNGKSVYKNLSNISDVVFSDWAGKGSFAEILPEKMQNAYGTFNNIQMKNNKVFRLNFVADSPENWSITTDESGNFELQTGMIYFLGAFYPNMDLRFMNQYLNLSVSGQYNSPYISDLKIIMQGTPQYVINGKFDGRVLNLQAKIIDIKSLLNPEYINNYESMQFLMPEPLFAPFSLNLPVVLSANHIKWGEDLYSDFTYSLRDGIQRISLTDKDFGGILAEIRKDKTNYKIQLQASKIMLHGSLLDKDSPINISDSSITAHAEMQTFGMTSHDVHSNLSGDLDIIFEGGSITGIGIDKFYESAGNMNRTTASNAVSEMMSGGQTQIKSLHISGSYENGEFQTTKPFIAYGIYPTKISGEVKVVKSKAQTKLSMFLNGTAETVQPWDLSITSDGNRVFSILGILKDLDIYYLQQFVASAL